MGLFSRKTELPAVSENGLSPDFGEPYDGHTRAPGGECLDASRDPWNRDEYAKAQRLVERALKAGLEDYDRSVAYDLLGQIHLANGRLGAAVAEFLKCLSCPTKSRDHTWSAGFRLMLIYQEAGRHEDVVKIGRLVEATGVDHALTGHGVKRLRKLARSHGVV